VIRNGSENCKTKREVNAVNLLKIMKFIMRNIRYSSANLYDLHYTHIKGTYAEMCGSNIHKL